MEYFQRIDDMHEDYHIKVDMQQIPFFSDEDKSGGKTHFSVRLPNGMFYNYQSNIADDAAHDMQSRFGLYVYNRIIELLEEESFDLLMFWKAQVPHYFSRTREGAARNYMSNTSSRNRGMYQVITAMRNNGAGESRLANALVVVDIGINGFTLGINPIMKGGYDVVSILKTGADPASHAPYYPPYDRRMPSWRGSWGGIPDTYWRIWDSAFKAQIAEAQGRINLMVRDIVEEAQHARTRDARSVRSGTYGRKEQRLQALTHNDNGYKRTFAIGRR